MTPTLAGADPASYRGIGCARTEGSVGWFYADPYAVLLDEEEKLRTPRRGGSEERRPQSAPVTLENRRMHLRSGVQPALRKGVSMKDEKVRTVDDDLAQPAGRLARLGHLTARYRWPVIVVWVVLT